MSKLAAILTCLLGCATLIASPLCHGQTSPNPALPEKVIIDTDIGDDIDDAFALALALRSPELQIIGVTTTFGDTETRAKLLDRFLAEVGRPEIPVAAGTPSLPKGTFTQRRYAEGGHYAKPSHPDAVAFILEQIRRFPGQITLIAIGPLMNVGAAIDNDPATFRKLKRIIMMGGSIKRGYGDIGYGPPHEPQPEWNILNDIPSAQKLFASSVPLLVMPLDSTQLKLDEVKRAFLFSQGTGHPAHRCAHPALSPMGPGNADPLRPHDHRLLGESHPLPRSTHAHPCGRQGSYAPRRRASWRTHRTQRPGLPRLQSGRLLPLPSPSPCFPRASNGRPIKSGGCPSCLVFR
jgi:Inosine-uridine preferring nucleoside hydrolase